MTARLLERQRRTFDSLVDNGIYSAGFDHAPKAKSFASSVLAAVGPRLPRRVPLTVLDCGCGTGAWLSFLHHWLTQAGMADIRLCGFDLSQRMIDVARDRLQALAVPADLRTGNVLERQSFAFEGVSAGFDLIFTYDVVQQVPRQRQVEACKMMVTALAPAGWALIFDNDSATRFGRRMALRKILTRYCGLRLVPRYYCNASYPPLAQIQQDFDSSPLTRARIMVRADGIKRAMIVQRHAVIGEPGAPQQAERPGS